VLAPTSERKNYIKALRAAVMNQRLPLMLLLL
jgi:hypothetical protein